MQHVFAVQCKMLVTYVLTAQQYNINTNIKLSLLSNGFWTINRSMYLKIRWNLFISFSFNAFDWILQVYGNVLVYSLHVSRLFSSRQVYATSRIRSRVAVWRQPLLTLHLMWPRILQHSSWMDLQRTPFIWKIPCLYFIWIPTTHIQERQVRV